MQGRFHESLWGYSESRKLDGNGVMDKYLS